jgi:hypothetical protein
LVFIEWGLNFRDLLEVYFLMQKIYKKAITTFFWQIKFTTAKILAYTV